MIIKQRNEIQECRYINTQMDTFNSIYLFDFFLLYKQEIYLGFGGLAVRSQVYVNNKFILIFVIEIYNVHIFCALYLDY